MKPDMTNFFDTEHNRQLVATDDEVRCVYCKREIPDGELVLNDESEPAHQWCFDNNEPNPQQKYSAIAEEEELDDGWDTIFRPLPKDEREL